MTRVLAVVDVEGGNYQIEVSAPGATNFVVALVVQLEAALEMKGLEGKQQAILDLIKALDVGRLKSEIVYRSKVAPGGVFPKVPA